MQRNAGSVCRRARWCGSILAVVAVAAGGLGVWGCGGRSARPEAQAYEDGTYRGSFIDRADIQVSVQFTLKDGVVTAASFRHLWGDDDFHLAASEEPYRSVIAQYQEALDHLVGRNLADHLGDLYRPGQIVTTQVHGYTGATIRSNKVVSAIRDALNRGVYSY